MTDDFAIGGRVRIDSYAYTIRHMIQGGMGLVLLCEAQTENVTALYRQRLAAKVFFPDQQQNQIQTELLLWNNLQHENIVSLLALGHANDWLCATMPWFVDGAIGTKSLHDKGGLPAIKAMLFQICSALNYALGKHRVLHLDIKPSNILSRGDNYCLADWGIAKIASRKAIAMDPASGGTLPYMSPERFSTEPTSSAADIYSIGMTAFEMLTATLPFDETNGHDLVKSIVVGRHLKRMESVVHHLPLNWKNFVLNCCDMNPANRPSTYAKLLETIKKLEE